MVNLRKRIFLNSILPWLLLFSLGVFLAPKIYTWQFSVVLSFTFCTLAFVFHFINIRLLFDRFFNRKAIHWYGISITALIILFLTLFSIVAAQGAIDLNPSLTDSQTAFLKERGAVFFVRRASGLAMIFVLIASTSSKLLLSQGHDENELENSDRTIILRAEGQNHKVVIGEIQYLKAESEYVAYHLDNEKLMVYGSLSEASENLAKDGFLRVHRSYVVSSNHIKAIGAKSLVMSDQTEIPIGRTYREAVKALSFAE